MTMGVWVGMCVRCVVVRVVRMERLERPRAAVRVQGAPDRAPLPLSNADGISLRLAPTLDASMVILVIAVRTGGTCVPRRRG